MWHSWSISENQYNDPGFDYDDLSDAGDEGFRGEHYDNGNIGEDVQAAGKQNMYDGPVGNFHVDNGRCTILVRRFIQKMKILQVLFESYVD